MTIRSLYRPTALSQSIPLSRGWLVLSVVLVAWLAFVCGGYGLVMLIGGAL